MKLKKRLLIWNTLIIFICLMMLVSVIGIVTNHFRIQYIDGVRIKDFEVEVQGSVNPVKIEKVTNMAAKNFYLALLCSVLISIAFILIISIFLTNKVINRIMKPVMLLMSANKRVENGNLSQSIDYTGDYEFEMLCSSFNKMQQSLKDEIELNKKEMQSKEDIISGISHDLKTPLTSIKGYIKGLKDGVATTDDKKEHYLDIAYKKTCEMDMLIEKLNEITKIQNKNEYINLELIGIDKIVNDYLDENEMEFLEKNIKINKQINTNQKVWADCEGLNRVFTNIIFNSIKYANSKNLIIDFSVFCDENIEIIIKDNGNGIKEDNLNKIFEQFYREDESRTKGATEGYGLGLYICKRIISQHNGTIKAQNDNGLKIIIILPKGE